MPRHAMRMCQVSCLQHMHARCHPECLVMAQEPRLTTLHSTPVPCLAGAVAEGCKRGGEDAAWLQSLLLGLQNGPPQLGQPVPAWATSMFRQWWAWACVRLRLGGDHLRDMGEDWPSKWLGCNGCGLSAGCAACATCCRILACSPLFTLPIGSLCLHIRQHAHRRNSRASTFLGFMPYFSLPQAPMVGPITVICRAKAGGGGMGVKWSACRSGKEHVCQAATHGTAYWVSPACSRFQHPPSTSHDPSRTCLTFSSLPRRFRLM